MSDEQKPSGPEFTVQHSTSAGSPVKLIYSDDVIELLKAESKFHNVSTAAISIAKLSRPYKQLSAWQAANTMNLN